MLPSNEHSDLSFLFSRIVSSRKTTSSWSEKDHLFQKPQDVLVSRCEISKKQEKLLFWLDQQILFDYNHCCPINQQSEQHANLADISGKQCLLETTETVLVASAPEK